MVKSIILTILFFAILYFSLLYQVINPPAELQTIVDYYSYQIEQLNMIGGK